MAYPINPYATYFQQYPQYQPQYQQPQPTPQQQGGIIWVSSIVEAQQYPMQPNSAVTLWDSNSPAVYVKQTDASGKPTLKIYDLVERTTTVSAAPLPDMGKYATMDALNELAARVDALSAKKVKVKREDDE